MGEQGLEELSVFLRLSRERFDQELKEQPLRRIEPEADLKSIDILQFDAAFSIEDLGHLNWRRKTHFPGPFAYRKTGIGFSSVIKGIDHEENGISVRVEIQRHVLGHG